MNPSRLIAGLAAIVVLVIAGYFLFFDRESASPVSVEVAQGDSVQSPATTGVAGETPPAGSAESAETAAPKPEAKQEPATATAQVPALQSGASGSEAGETQSESTETAALQTPKVVPNRGDGQPRPAPESLLPSFDVVRVEPSGEAVIAGRTGPGNIVTLYDGAVALGSVTADSTGQWVLVLDTPLAPGTHELSLQAKAADGSILLSANVVVVSVPQRRIAAASQPAQAQPAQTQPAQTQPAQIQPAQIQPAQSRPAETQPAAAVPAEPQAAESRAVAQRPTAETTPESVQAATEAPAPVQPAAPAAQGAGLTGTGAPEPAAGQVAALPANSPASKAEPEQPLAVLMPRSGGGVIRVLQQPESPDRGLGEGTLILESVDYDAAGQSTIGGRAEPGARLIVYLDGKPLGQIVAGTAGRWEITLDQPVSQGLHRIRVDQLDEAGRVVARVETPFSRAAMVATLPDQTAVIVQPGNSLWRISRRVYGKGLQYSVIYQANRDQIRDPDLIYPGQIFVVPVAN